MIILGAGANRLSAQGLLEEIMMAKKEMREEHLQETKRTGQYLFENLPDDMAELMEDVRHGRRDL